MRERASEQGEISSELLRTLFGEIKRNAPVLLCGLNEREVREIISQTQTAFCRTQFQLVDMDGVLGMGTDLLELSGRPCIIFNIDLGESDQEDTLCLFRSERERSYPTQVLILKPDTWQTPHPQHPCFQWASKLDRNGRTRL